jgi:hypothetical protein
MRLLSMPPPMKMAGAATVSVLATAVAASRGFFLTIKSPRLLGESGRRGYHNSHFHRRSKKRKTLPLFCRHFSFLLNEVRRPPRETQRWTGRGLLDAVEHSSKHRRRSGHTSHGQTPVLRSVRV